MHNLCNYTLFKLRGGASMIALLGRLVCLSVKKISKWLKQRNLIWRWKQKMSARLSRPLISSQTFYFVCMLVCPHVFLTTHILDHTYPELYVRLQSFLFQNTYLNLDVLYMLHCRNVLKCIIMHSIHSLPDSYTPRLESPTNQYNLKYNLSKISHIYRACGCL